CLAFRTGGITHPGRQALTIQLTRGVRKRALLTLVAARSAGHLLDRLLEPFGTISQSFLLACPAPRRISVVLTSAARARFGRQLALRIGKLPRLELQL